jgi:hypothetical protein
MNRSAYVIRGPIVEETVTHPPKRNNCRAQETLGNLGTLSPASEFREKYKNKNQVIVLPATRNKTTSDRSLDT